MKYTKDNPLRVITLCSGYDSQCLAFEKLKKKYTLFDYELIAWSEFDPETPNKPLEQQPAVVAHNALFPQWSDRNLGDMTEIDWTQVPDFDLLFYSTPCQSISSAGLQHGFTEGSGTRSSIIWNVRDAVKTKRPKYLCLENVKAMVQGKFVKMFNLWQKELEQLGYSNFAKVLNSRDYGIPQSRERIFLFSIRNDGDNLKYFFPEPIKLENKIESYLENNVDESYYLKESAVSHFFDEKKSINDENNNKDILICAIRGRSDGEWEKQVHYQKIEIRKEVCNTITSVSKDNLIIEVGKSIIVYDDFNRQIASDQSVVGTVRQTFSNISRGNGIKLIEIEGKNEQINNKNLPKELVGKKFRIRCFTEKEAFRLMGVDDADIEKIQAAGLSKSAQYKLAGNSIVVDVLYHIFRKAFIETENENSQLTLF